MAHLRKKGRSYFAEFYSPERTPVRKWVTLRTTDKVAANSKMVDLDRRYSLGNFDPWADKVSSRLTVQGAIERFLKSRDHCTPKTIRHYREVLRLLDRVLQPGELVERVSSGDIKAFLANSAVSNATARNYHRHVRAFFVWAVSEGLIKESPVHGIRLPKEQKAVPEYLSRQELDTLLRTIRSDHEANPYLGRDKTLWIPDLVEFACYTGLRLGELCRLRWRDVDLVHDHVTVRNTDAGTTKTGEERRVPVVGRAREILQSLAGGSPGSDAPVFTSGTGQVLDGAYVSRRFRKYRKLAKLPVEISFHSLRHTCASWLVMAGVSLYTVKEVLGHSSITVTQRYAHLAPATMRDEMQRALG